MEFGCKASEREIRAAYKQQAILYHPDKQTGNIVATVIHNCMLFVDAVELTHCVEQGRVKKRRMKRLQGSSS